MKIQGNNHIPPTGNSHSSVKWFHWIWRSRVSASLYSTKSTSPSASIPQKHNCSSCNAIPSTIPTLPKVIRVMRKIILNSAISLFCNFIILHTHATKSYPNGHNPAKKHGYIYETRTR